MVDSGVLADTGIFIDSPEVRRIPVLLLDWPLAATDAAQGLEVIWLSVGVSIRGADMVMSGSQAVVLMPGRPYFGRRLGTDAATGLSLYEFEFRHPFPPDPEYARLADTYDRERGEVADVTPMLQFGIKEGGILRVAGVDCQVAVLMTDGKRAVRPDGEYLFVKEAIDGVPTGAIFLGRLVGTQPETNKPVFEGEPAKLPAYRPKRRRRPTD